MTRRTPRTIRSRVAWTTFAILAVVLFAAGLTIDRFDYHVAVEAVDSRLAAEAEGIAAVTRFDGSKIIVDFQDEIITGFAKPRCGAYFQISTPRGVIERSRSLAGSALPDPRPEDLLPLDSVHARRATVAASTGPFEPAVRLHTLAVKRVPEPAEHHAGAAHTASPESHGDRVSDAGITVVVQVARSISEIESSWSEERAAVVSGLGLALVLGTLGAFFVARKATGPIKDLTDEARAIASGSPARLDVHAVDGELRELADLLNQGFDRLSSTVAREKRFSADAAHELRTPVTASRAQIELALSRERTSQEYKATLASLLDVTVRQQSLIEGLLFLARAERPLDQSEPVDLRALLISTFGTAASASGREPRVALDLPGKPVFVAGHRDLLACLVTGLVDNARRHGGSPESVEVALAETGVDAVLSVLDRGPGFPPELLDRLFERLARGDASRSRATGGAGLGLSIAKAIVDAHHGTITAGPRPGGGACVRVSFALVQVPVAS
jgi:signal transduction histidine kinase